MLGLYCIVLSILQSGMIRATLTEYKFIDQKQTEVQEDDESKLHFAAVERISKK